MRPNVARVRRDEERQVADQPQTLAMRVGLQALGLAEHQELRKTRQADLIGELKPCPLERGRLALDEFGRPIKIRRVVEPYFQSPEEGVVIQPMILILAELLIRWAKVSPSARSEVVPSFFEQQMFKRDHGLVINASH